MVGPLLGLGLVWAEGRSSARKPKLVAGSTDDAIWDNSFGLNRLLLAVNFGTFVTVLILYCSRHPSFINLLGSFASGCLASVLTFVGITYPHVTERYKQLARFEQLRYGYRVPSGLFVVSIAALGLVWVAYVVLHV